MRVLLPWSLALALVLPACAHNALPPMLGSVEPTQYSTLEVPAILDVLSVDYEAVAYDGGSDEGVTARVFLKVYGRHRESGTLYLLIYERGTDRRDPIDVIEIVPAEVVGIVPDRRP